VALEKNTYSTINLFMQLILIYIYKIQLNTNISKSFYKRQDLKMKKFTSITLVLNILRI